ncbi:hypothetical protein [Streptomyces wuyuanensis]
MERTADLVPDRGQGGRLKEEAFDVAVARSSSFPGALERSVSGDAALSGN